MVEGRWLVAASSKLNNEQKQTIAEKLANRITSDGFLLVKSQQERTQLGNKTIVVKKMNELVNAALQKKKARIATKPSKAGQARRSDEKKKQSDRKENRKKIKPV